MNIPPSPSGVEFPRRVVVEIRRGSSKWFARFELEKQHVDLRDETKLRFEGTVLKRGDGASPSADFELIFELFKHLSNTIYIGAFRNALSLSSDQDYFDIKVGQSFIASWNSLKAGNAKKLNNIIESVTEDVRRIFGFEKLEINASADQKTFRININGRPFALSELGSGLVHFILVLASAAIRDRPVSSVLWTNQN